jgi:integrase
MPFLVNKRVSPHTIRHTTACHLLRAGVDYQHDSRLARSRLPGHHEYLRGNRSGDEGQSSRDVRGCR